MQFSGPDSTLVASYPVAEATWNEDKNPLLPSGIIGRERDCVRFKSTSLLTCITKWNIFQYSIITYYGLCTTEISYVQDLYNVTFYANNDSHKCRN